MAESERFDPDWVVRPGATLVECADENGLSLRVLAQKCGLEPVVVTGVVTGRQRITEPIAERLAHGTGVSARMWLNLERNYREGLAAGKREV